MSGLGVEKAGAQEAQNRHLEVVENSHFRPAAGGGPGSWLDVA